MEVEYSHMKYTEYGDLNAPLILFIHGAGVGGWMWDKQVDYFSQKYHCVVPEILDPMNPETDRFTIHGTAVKLCELIETKAKGKTVIVVGFSLGAQVLIAMLGMKPNSIHYAMINSALVRPIPFANWLSKSLILAYPLARIEAFARLQAKHMYIDEAYFPTYYEDSLKLSRAAFIRIMNENMSFTIPDHFHKATGRILITAGEKEKKIMQLSLIALVEHNSNCRGVVIPDMGHGLSFADPAYFNQLLEGLIDGRSNPAEVKK
jgi:pimeloyl-ACP methyl ester carboxylesterase